MDVPSADAIVDHILAASLPYEFRTFVIGFERADDFLREEHEACFRPLKIAVGDELLRLWPEKDVDFKRPEVRFNVFEGPRVEVEAAPLFIAGRYRKLSREIPATRWIHHRCHGRGCPECGHTGTLCGPSVQELIEAPALAATGGLSTLFHGMGREDTDV